MLDYEEHEHASYNANQAKLLRGRKLSELSPYEQLQFANLMSIARAAPGETEQPQYRFIIDSKKLENADGLMKVKVANGAADIAKQAATLRHSRA